MKSFSGIHTALVTPFKKDGSVDFNSWKTLVSRQVKAGIHGITPSGTTGESPTLSNHEKIKLVETAIDASKKKILIIPGTGSNDTDKTVKFTKEISKISDACLVVTPYYNKPSQTGLIRHFSKVADNSDVPIILYNVPGRTGVGLLPSTIATLSKHGNIAGIKEATGDLTFFMKIKRAIQENGSDTFTLLSGDDPTIWPFLSAGGDGVFSVASNILPNSVVELYDLHSTRKKEKGLKLYDELFDFFEAIFLETNPVPSKFILSKLGYIEKVVRAPLADMSKENEMKFMKIWNSISKKIRRAE